MNLLHESARRHYEHFQNAYHSYGHACEVYKVVADNDAKWAVQLAAVWHDAIYIPGAPNGINEEMSAWALTQAWTDHSNLPVLHEACRLIGGTSVDNHLMRVNLPMCGQALLLDADLFSLASNYDEFVARQSLIHLENRLQPNTKGSRSRTANFLSVFLNVRPNIYHVLTQYEQKARENIQRYCDETYSMKS